MAPRHLVGDRGRPRDRVLPRLQPGPLRFALGVRVWAGVAPAVPRGETGARPVLARPRPDEPGAVPGAHAERHPGLPVLQARRPRDVGVPDEPGPALRGPGRLAPATRLVAARGHDRGADPDAPLL